MLPTCLPYQRPSWSPSPSLSPRRSVGECVLKTIIPNLLCWTQRGHLRKALTSDARLGVLMLLFLLKFDQLYLLKIWLDDGTLAWTKPRLPTVLLLRKGWEIWRIRWLGDWKHRGGGPSGSWRASGSLILCISNATVLWDRSLLPRYLRMVKVTMNSIKLWRKETAVTDCCN